MSDVPPDTLRRPRIARLFRLQWEEAQQAHVLLFPEGLVKLNQSAGEILRRCDGTRSVAELVAELETAFSTVNLAPDVEAFLAHATTRGWIEP